MALSLSLASSSIPAKPTASISNSNPQTLNSPLRPALSSNSRSISFGLQLNRGHRLSASAGFSETVLAVVKTDEPLKVMISGAPASGKGTQCELIRNKYGFVHIAAGDLLRAEIGAGTENGKVAKEYMEKGLLVPNEVVVKMVKDRLFQPDAEENGWLLDGYPRSFSQAKALEDLQIRPDIFLLLEVSEEILVDRVVGRRLDPVTGKIYHLKYSPPESEEISARLTQRFDDTEEKVKLRLKTHNQNVEDVLAIYQDITYRVNGNLPKEDVFAEIDKALSSMVEKRSNTMPSVAATGMHR